MHYMKYIFVCFKKNISRFIAVIAIVALGVGILVGLLSSPTDLKNSMSQYYISNNLYDLNIKSSVGFSSDILDIVNLDDAVINTLYINEDKMDYNNQHYNARLISTCISDDINKLTLVDGRYPEKENECLVLYDNSIYLNINVDESFIFNNITYKVVGIVKSPMFLSSQKEYTLTGSNKVDFIFYLDNNYNSYETITDLYIRFTNLNLNKFSDQYNLKINEYKNIIKTKENDILNARKNELYDSIKIEVTNKVKEELLKANPEYSVVIDSIMNSDEIKEQISLTTISELEKIINENGCQLYYLDLTSNLTYKSFIENVNKINKVAIVFPFFFFLIAALIALTTITRLVEEERTSIGLLKSLGYSKTKICIKYVLYGLICAIIGSILGSLLGIVILPYVIHVAFNTLFMMPEFICIYDVFSNILAVSLMIFTITLVSLYVSLKTLKERPCNLLLPKAPKPGKRILLENIPFIWNKIKFKYKNMLRNIFRYKKNLFMMVVGVGGCVALLLVAFGINEVVSSLGDMQYKDILTYDLKVAITKDSTINIDNIESLTYANIDSVYLDNDSLKEYELSLVTTNTTISNFINFKQNNKHIDINIGDVVITKQLSSHFNLKLGDTFYINNNKNIVSKIVDNYIDNYIYVIKEDYSYNCCYINTNNQDETINTLTNLDNVKTIEVKSMISSTYDSMASSMIMVVLVIILCSGALAVIVIYNLTNININERIKEIATLKVIGYQKSEVCLYIYREVFLMSLMGILLGFIIGPLFFKFVIYSLESPGIFYSNIISPIYYLYSFILTIIFVIIVDILFIFKIKNIKMVESLKCVD